MATDPHAIWKPGYDGPAPVLAPRPDHDEPRPTRDDAPSSDRSGPRASTPTANAPAIDAARVRGGRRRRRRSLAVTAGVATVTLAIASVVIWSATDDNAPSGEVRPGATADQGSSGPVFAPVDASDSLLDVTGRTGAPFAGADPRRLPDRVDELWRRPLTTDETANRSVEVSAIRADRVTDPWVEVIDDRFVLTATAGPSTDSTASSTLQLRASDTGATAWSMVFDVSLPGFSFVGAIEDVVIVSVNGTSITGLDVTSGSTVWERADIDDARIGILEGTDFVALWPSSDGEAVVLIDAMTGVQVGGLDGTVVGTDRVGWWYVARNGEVLEYDLRGRFAKGIPIGTYDQERSRVVSVVDRQVVTTDSDWLAVSDDRGEPPDTVLVEVGDGIPEQPATITSIEAMVASTFLAAGAGSIAGADLTDGLVRLVWERDGVIVTTQATERGVVLLVSLQGGAAQQVIDGRTGETIVALTMTPGVFDSLEIIGNGVLTQRVSADGPRIAGLDLDGTELWSLDGSAPAAVGDGLVVRVEDRAQGPMLVAYGDTP